jgi:hypothetical protein
MRALGGKAPKLTLKNDKDIALTFELYLFLLDIIDI